MFGRRTPLRQVSCCGHGGQKMSIDRGGLGAAASRRTAARRSAANMSSVTLSADVGS